MKPNQLTHENFQEFLEENKEYIFIHQDEEGNNPQYFPVEQITLSSKGNGKFVRQA